MMAPAIVVTRMEPSRSKAFGGPPPQLRGGGSSAGDHGFTLLELIAVLAILALCAAALVPLAPTSGRSIDIDAAAREVALGLRAARSAAIFGNRETTFTLDGAAGRYWSDAAPAPKPLPARISAAVGPRERSLGRIRFFPDGSAGGGFVLLRGPDRAATVRIDALTGSATIHVRP